MIPLPSQATSSGLRVVVLTCGDLGIEVANALSCVAGVDVVALFKSPWMRSALSVRQKIRHVVRTQGVGGLFRVARSRILPRTTTTRELMSLDSRVTLLEFDDFHSPAARERLVELRPDLGVVAGTYILRDGIFDIPRYGSINLHSGKAQLYRGSAPAFWELYNGETEVGITIHRVSPAVDAGDVLRQEIFALDSAPSGDPIAYIERYRRDVLRPNGVRMLVDVVREIAAGTAIATAQDHSAARTYRAPDYKAVRELRARVRRRRGGAT
ncbi:MAG TPA: formyltransferase family protein [Gemmatimonadaceae bacterium]|nr:formyltransferase family protein [Gemmatimonadaceae bacterium]